MAYADDLRDAWAANLTRGAPVRGDGRVEMPHRGNTVLRHGEARRTGDDRPTIGELFEQIYLGRSEEMAQRPLAHTYMRPGRHQAPPDAPKERRPTRGETADRERREAAETRVAELEGENATLRRERRLQRAVERQAETRARGREATIAGL